MKVSTIKKAAKALTAPALGVGLLVSVVGTPAVATHTPANKVAASGANVDTVDYDTVLLQEHVKINNPTDLILGATAECAIVTQVTSGATGATDYAFGEVTVYLTLDGIVVPIESADYTGTVVTDPVTHEALPGATTGNGEVVFCNRAQEQQWADGPAVTDPDTGQATDPQDEDDDDELRQRLDTMQANGFNWLALNVGDNYDANNDNIIDVVLHARYTRATTDGSLNEGELADAFVGARTLILEPVKAANDEAVTTVSERG